MPKNKYKVRRYWEMYDEVEVEVNEGDEAMIVAHAIALPLTDGEYVSDSINVDETIDVIKL